MHRRAPKTARRAALHRMSDLDSENQAPSCGSPRRSRNTTRIDGHRIRGHQRHAFDRGIKHPGAMLRRGQAKSSARSIVNFDDVFQPSRLGARFASAGARWFCACALVVPARTTTERLGVHMALEPRAKILVGVHRLCLLPGQSRHDEVPATARSSVIGQHVLW